MRLEAVRPLAEVKAEVKARVKGAYLAISSGVSVQSGRQIYVDCPAGEASIRMNAGTQAAMLMDSGIRVAENLGEEHMVVRDYHNVNHALSVEMAKIILASQAADARRYWLRKGEIEESIDAAQSVAELRAIDTGFGEVWE